MYGWKARFGVAVPSANAVMERELNLMCPEGVSVHFSRMWLKADTKEEILGLYDKVKEAVELLSHVNPSVIAFGCTAGSLIKGLGYDREIIKIIEESTGVHATSTSTAVVEALRALEVRRVAVGSPYEPWLNAKVKEFLEANGFEVTATEGLGIIGPEMSDLGAVQLYSLARKALQRPADCLFLSCTGMPSATLIDGLEKDFGLAVISSNQATFWHMLRLVGIKSAVHGFGVLLEKL